MRQASHRSAGARVALILALSLSAAAAVGCGAASAATTANEAGTAQAARWVQKKLHFTYMGFTTHYSCEGLEAKVRSVLLQLGARRAGLDVHSLGCTEPFGRPEAFPGVVGSFYVLEPLSNGQAGHASGATVAAHWQTVRVLLSRSALDAAGQCELLEQVKQRILPLFAARDVRFRSICVPHQVTLPGAALRVEVLKPGERSAAAVAQPNGAGVARVD
ncbi:MAG: hypothetical protein ACRETB_10350 [Steroidobacteraceae bacterium]